MLLLSFSISNLLSFLWSYYLYNKLKVLELIEISILLLFKCFDFASGEITIIWRADIKRVNMLFCFFKVNHS